MADVIVVGGGIVGAAVAYNLARRGAAVTVLEAARPAAGTSSRSFAWANANAKPPHPYHELNAAGVAAHHVLRDELGAGGFHPTGNLEIVRTSEHRDELNRRVAQLHDWGYLAELVSIERARELAPGIEVVADATVAFFPDEGWVAAPVLIGQLLAGAVRHGARVIWPAPVEGLYAEGNRVAGVRTRNEIFAANVVVDCSGPVGGKLIEPLGRSISRQRAPGVLIVTETLPSILDRPVHAEGVYVRPDGGGRILVGSTDVDAMLPPDFAPGDVLPVDSAPVREMQRRGAALMPLLADARIDTVRVGWRPMPADGFSAVGPLAGIEGYYLVFTHSGVTLAPILGKLVAEEITSGRSSPMLAPFRPDRLS